MIRGSEYKKQFGVSELMDIVEYFVKIERNKTFLAIQFCFGAPTCV